MLQILRNKAQSIVIQAVVVVIAIVFIFWGVGTNLLNNREAALDINGEEVSFQDFQTAYDRAYNNIRNQFGGNVPEGLLENLGIKQQVIRQLIQEALLRQGAAEMGILISKEEVQQTVQEMVQFQQDGKFNIEKYNTLLAANNYSPVKFEETVRFDMLSQKVSLAIGKFAATATEHEREELYNLDKSSVSFRYVKISPDDYSDIITASDEDLEKWYPTVQEKYKTSPEIQLRYLDYSYSSIGKKITIDNESAEKYYQDNIDRFTTPEKRGARHILFKADENSPAEVHEQQKTKAEEIAELAKSGSDFAELAKQYSEGPSKDSGGDLGLFSRGQMVAPFEEAVFSLEVDGISDVVKTSFGYHIIKLEKIVAEEQKAFSEVKDTIVVDMQTQQARPMAFQLATEAYENIIGAGSLEAFLEAHPDAPVRNTSFFSRNTPPEEIGPDQKFLSAAFSLKKGELSSLTETDKGYVILFAQALKEPEVPELSEVKEKVLLDYKRSTTEKMAEEAATSLLQQTKSENSLSATAEKGGFTLSESGFIGKTQSPTNTLPQSVVETAFKLSAKEPYTEEPIKNGNSYFIIEFLQQKSPEEPMGDEDRERYSNAIIQKKQQQILSSWLKNKEERSKVFTHKSL